MKLIAPDYYPEFRCIADKCRHSCCIGWEIDIDPDTREQYRRVPGAFGERLNAAIDDSGEYPVFRLCADGRCAMLNPSGLCDLITQLGESALCQICADHPRFRNFWGQSKVGHSPTSDSDCLQSPSVASTRPCAEGWPRTEGGLGLCCEEAARLILTRETPMELLTLEDDGADDALDEEDEALLAIRDTLITLMQEHDTPLQERLDEVLMLGGLPIPEMNWPQIYRELERLDPAWDAALDSLAGAQHALSPALDVPLANFCAYLLYRHLPGAMEDEDVPGRVAFCVLSTRMLMALCAAKPGCTPEDCIDLARMYSAEIEYSEENIAALLDTLWEE